MSATTSGSDPRAVPCQALEIGSSSGSLEPDEVSSQQALDELFAPRQTAVKLNRRERNVKEESNAQIWSHLTQVLRYEVELVILHPHGGALCGLFSSLLGKPLVDLLECVPPLTVEDWLDNAVVVQRPQGRVREPLVVLLDLLGAQWYRVDVITVMVEGFDDFVRRAMPSDPCAALALHDRLQSGDEAAGGGLPTNAAVVVDLAVYG